MKISDCMSSDVRIASPAWSIRDAARAMREIDSGFLPVGENDRLVGAVTDRDIVIRAVAEDKGLETKVRDVMSDEIIYCYDDEDLDAVATRMSDRKIRRLPVLNHDKRLVGVVSLGDLSQSPEDDGRRSAAALGSISTPGGEHVQ
ncbi:CBS domain-containing protein [Dongia deserti]|uniref:CBS domain-containing protein n=1 Tax=Dongia deserti TaxID=2268030 RepID=UPI000E649C07|nr:CBS domain-containing protein [Dongia deserti]